MIHANPPQVIVAPAPQSIHYVYFKGDKKLVEEHQIWANFEELSSIYRESGHNKEASDYLKKRLQKAGFVVEQKDTDTICAYRGLNSKQDNAVILQAHMDIVSISADGNSKKPIELKVKDGWLYANERTLGADNGLGVAAILSVADDSRFKNYPLEMIITTDEETGMDGARKLSSEDFKGKFLINLDTEEFGHIVKGCAGIAQFSVNEKFSTQKLAESDYTKVSVKLSGARGGHSATITNESLNPIKILVSDLKAIQGAKLVSISGGERYNAIPRDAEAVFLVKNSELNAIVESLQETLEKIKSENAEKNPNFEVKIVSDVAKVGTEYIAPDFQVKMLNALDTVPAGLFSRFDGGKYSKTSQNLGVLMVKDGNFYVQIMGRSADNKEGAELKDKTAKILSDLFDKKISVSDTTPIWQPIDDSKLQKTAVEAFLKVCPSITPTVQVEHGGLESAIFTPKRPDIDQISIGPTIEEPHSIQERVKIDTVVPFYDWLSVLLEQLAKK